MIPAVTRDEWRKLISSELDDKVQSYSLRLKLDSLRQKIKQQLLTEDDAINDLYRFCGENEDILINDFENIFRD